MMDYEPMEITCHYGSDDCTLFQSIVNQGIDSRLEAFTQSSFSWDGCRLVMSFHPDEVQILLRRLCEIYDAMASADPYENEHIGLWIEDIMAAQYGYEVI